MTDFCPKCGKKAEDGEKICSVCGEEMANISQDVEKNKRDNKNNRNKLIGNTFAIVSIIVVLFLGINVGVRYFNAGKNIANSTKSQKSELKILKRPSGSTYDKSEEDDIVKKEVSTEERHEEGSSKDENSSENKNQNEKNPVLKKKDKYMKIMADLDKEVRELADSDLNGNQEELLNYTSKIYKKYDTVLNMIYGDITSALENEELEELKKEENDWIQKKEEMASYDVGTEDTTESDENWAYFDSLATSTKERCYYLIYNYMH